MSSAVPSTLPAYCSPTTPFLQHFSALFHTCIPTPLAFLSNTLGILSIISWLFSQLPQIHKNWKLKSTAGLSFNFLLIWFLGDLSNLLGAVFTHQATWQVVMASYYCFVDVVLISQWVWYEVLGRGREMRGVVVKARSPVSSRRGSQSDDDGKDSASKLKMGKASTRPRAIFRTPDYTQISPARHEGSYYSPLSTPRGTDIHVTGTPPPPYSPSSRTLLLAACLAANIAQATPISKPLPPPTDTIIAPESALEQAGTILSWMSTLLYLGSRLPQLVKNWRRKSTSGLSPQLFAAAFCGNLFYSSALLTNPCAWFEFGAYGGGGWVGVEGSERGKWVSAALPFFLGAAGVLVLDASVGVQFVAYGGDDGEVLVVEAREGGRGTWRRVSGWMRGWIPRSSLERRGERQALLRDGRRETRGCATL